MKYYSTSDPESLEAFLRASDVLVCSLPGTAKTKYLLDRHKLGGPSVAMLVWRLIPLQHCSPKTQCSSTSDGDH